jgi:hypothetical protein
MQSSYELGICHGYCCGNGEFNLKICDKPSPIPVIFIRNWERVGRCVVPYWSKVVI